MKCPSCGVGFIPEVVKPLIRFPSENAKPGNAAVAGVVLTMVLAGLAAALVSIWLGIGLAVVGLLAVIAMQLGARKSE
jgi:hypothetical protein